MHTRSTATGELVYWWERRKMTGEELRSRGTVPGAGKETREATGRVTVGN